MYSCYVCALAVHVDIAVFCTWKVVEGTNGRKFSIENDELFLWFYEVKVFASPLHKHDYDFKNDWIMIYAMLKFDTAVCHQLGQGTVQGQWRWILRNNDRDLRRLDSSVGLVTVVTRLLAEQLSWFSDCSY
jgi:hypothetical protein